MKALSESSRLAETTDCSLNKPMPLGFMSGIRFANGPGGSERQKNNHPTVNNYTLPLKVHQISRHSTTLLFSE